MNAAALDIPGVWRASEAPADARIGTHSAVLDAAFGGWPQGALTQIDSAAPGLGFSLLLPTLAALTAAGRLVMLIDPPHLPYAPALAARGVALEQLFWLEAPATTGALWAAEQTLRSGVFGAVAYWGAPLPASAGRRLQLAAAAAQCLMFCFGAGPADGAGYAALRLAVTAAEGRLRVTVLRCRGRRVGHSVLYGDLPVDRDAA